MNNLSLLNDSVRPSQGGVVRLPSFGQVRICPRESTRLDGERAAKEKREQKALFFLPKKPYEQAISLLRQFLYQDHHGSHGAEDVSPFAAWITTPSSLFVPSPPAFESRDLFLQHLVFIETCRLAQTLRTLFFENYFEAVVVDASSNQAMLQLARHWTKVERGEQLLSADSLELKKRNKLVIFLE